MNYQRKILNQTLLVFIIVNLILILLLFLKPVAGRTIVLATGAAVFILATLIVSKREGLDAYILGLYSDSFKKDIKFLLIVIIIVFPVFFFANHLYQTLILKHQLRLSFREGILSVCVSNLLTAAIPEEVFFRGYIQSQLSKVYNNRGTLGFVTYANLLSSALFALGHFFINPRPERLAVFFPSLLFGYLREKRGNIYPSVAIHWLSNLIMYIMLGMYG